MKYEIYIITFIILCFFGSCKTSDLHGYGSPATEVRTELDGLRTEQAESARTGERIKGESEEIERVCGELAGTITDGAEYCNELRKIIDEIRGREQQLDE